MRLNTIIFIAIIFVCECGLAQVKCSHEKNTRSGSLMSLKDEEMTFRRRAFEDATLNYIELNLSSTENKFGREDSLKRCKTLFQLDFVEYENRANILHARLLLMDFSAEKDKLLWDLLEEISKSSGLSLEKIKQQDELLRDIEAYRKKCMTKQLGDKQTVAKLGQYLDSVKALEKQLRELHEHAKVKGPKPEWTK